MSGGIDEIDEETSAVRFLSDKGHVLLRQLVVEGDGTVGGVRVSATFSSLHIYT